MLTVKIQRSTKEQINVQMYTIFLSEGLPSFLSRTLEVRVYMLKLNAKVFYSHLLSEVRIERQTYAFLIRVHS